MGLTSEGARGPQTFQPGNIFYALPTQIKLQQSAFCFFQIKKKKLKSSQGSVLHTFAVIFGALFKRGSRTWQKLQCAQLLTELTKQCSDSPLSNRITSFMKTAMALIMKDMKRCI